MSNISELHSTHDITRASRAAFVHDALKSERWSIRQAAMAIGMSHTVLGTRANGSTAFLADEIEAIAKLLKRDPVEFYREYLNAGNGGRPEPSNNTVEYGSLAPVTSISEARSLKAHTDSTRKAI